MPSVTISSSRKMAAGTRGEAFCAGRLSIKLSQHDSRRAGFDVSDAAAARIATAITAASLFLMTLPPPIGIAASMTGVTFESVSLQLLSDCRVRERFVALRSSILRFQCRESVGPRSNRDGINGAIKCWSFALASDIPRGGLSIQCKKLHRELVMAPGSKRSWSTFWFVDPIGCGRCGQTWPEMY
jgi:hypothetical protein